MALRCLWRHIGEALPRKNMAPRNPARQLHEQEQRKDHEHGDAEARVPFEEVRGGKAYLVKQLRETGLEERKARPTTSLR